MNTKDTKGIIESIPEQELEITTSRSGGAGGQHVNKTDTKVTIRWNIKITAILSDDQKSYLLERLKNRITSEGTLVIHNNESRSQQQNKQAALEKLIHVINQALIIPKKRLKTKASQEARQKRLEDKIRRSSLKQLRSKQYDE